MTLNDHNRPWTILNWPQMNSFFHLSDRSSFFCIIFNWTWNCSSCIFSWAATWNGWFCSFTRIWDECQTSHVLEFSLGKKNQRLKSHTSQKDIKIPSSLRIHVYEFYWAMLYLFEKRYTLESLFKCFIQSFTCFIGFFGGVYLSNEEEVGVWILGIGLVRKIHVKALPTATSLN